MSIREGKKDKRKCEFAIRNTTEKQLKVFTFYDFNGDAEEFQNVIWSHPDSDTMTSDECLKIVQDCGMACSKVEISIIKDHK